MKRSQSLEWLWLIFVLVSTSILVVWTTARLQSRGDDAAVFALAMIGLPMLCLLGSRSRLVERLHRVGAAVLYWLIFYRVYVNYQNRPWFAQDPPGGCDGPCFGWYTFENPPIVGWLLVAASISTIMSLSIYGLSNGLATVWKRKHTD